MFLDIQYFVYFHFNTLKNYHVILLLGTTIRVASSFDPVKLKKAFGLFFNQPKQLKRF